MDEIDKTEQDSSLIMEAKLQEIRQKAAPIPTSAVCLNCGEPTENGARWCCPECRDQWEKENEK